MVEASEFVGTAEMPMLSFMWRAFFAVDRWYEGIDFACVHCARTRASVRIRARISKKWERIDMPGLTLVRERAGLVSVPPPGTAYKGAYPMGYSFVHAAAVGPRRRRRSQLNFD